ncbi:MAG TPA: PSD1 and planctomycete cytochrome C domain-containing protein, partial [Gemmataceae bacterium]|nr:PSD1 and planctomycete cytochrome C domain-containing protein [Gemmataceae bacterium]
VAILAVSIALMAPTVQAAPPAQPASQAAAEFFEARVRPILVEHCIACHGPKKQKGGLRLDSRQALIQGGDDGAAIVAGQPDKSLLVRAVRRQGDVKMPPKKPLSTEQVTALAGWVKMGAPWPESATAHASAQNAWKTHWAFQPIRKPALPPVKDHAWVQSPIDAFVLAKLEARGLRPAHPADRRTLLRRVTFDLIGLPPTPAEVAAFEADQSPQAFEKVVDRLLASPHYGERWGRYWLDVARYADTKGYVFDQDRHFPCSYSYRDYVIHAFNDDLPYNRFILEQLAADQLPLGGDRQPLAAMGFLTLGNRFMNNRNDIIDDQIDVTCRGLLGLTVACARCHDHKYDPIPSKDYYSLYGVFRSSIEPHALPVIAEPRHTSAYAAYEKQLAVLDGKLWDFLKKKHEAYAAEWRTHVADYLMQVYRHRRQPNTRDFMFVIQPGQVNPKIIQRWRDYLARHHGHDPVFAPWNVFFALAEKDFKARAPAIAARFAASKDAAGPINPLVAQLFVGPPPATMQDVANRYGKLFADVDGQWQKSHKEPTGPQQQVWQVLHGPDTPTNVPLRDIQPYVLDRPARNVLTKLRNEIAHFKGTSPAAPPRAMILRDGPTPYEPRVFIRGNPGRPGPAVPRQFLEVLAGPHRQPFHHGSGRLDLAQAIIAPDNPLTARVIVNRIWLHHFGAGLVRTPSDFGMRSDPPTHPALLDYLASRFMQEGWSIKRLHRLILLSSTYQQSSDADPAIVQADPENRLLTHMNRQRLDFEALRDGLLAVSGKLDDAIGGYPVQLTARPFSGRRTVYGYIDRLDLPSVYRTFDFPNPDSSSPQRPQTSVPLQALFLMNSPFVVDQARHVMQRPDIASQQGQAARVRALYQLLFGRVPDADELALAQGFLHDADTKMPGDRLTPWERYAQVLLLSNEFAFVD